MPTLGEIVSPVTPVSEVSVTGTLAREGSALVCSWNVWEPVALAGLASPYHWTCTRSPGLTVTLAGTWKVID